MSLSGSISLALRVSGTSETPSESTSPIQGYEKVPLVTLEKAVEPLELIVPNIKQMLYHVKCNLKLSPADLPVDELLAIRLYTLSWTSDGQHFYQILNKKLREAKQDHLRPWFFYLKLCTTALLRLPSDWQFLYRGVKDVNLAKEYLEGKTYYWWTFTSCTTSAKVLESDTFLGKTNTRTIFTINCWSGKDIRKYSEVSSEDEVLLLPGFHFKVISNLDLGNGLTMIQIEELDTGPSQTSAISVPEKLLLPCKPLHRNEKLEQLIQKSTPRKIDLSSQQLKDRDMEIVGKLGIHDKKCKILDLMCNEITHEGVAILSNAIRDNQDLEELNLSQNTISASGVQHLTSVMNSSALKRIDLSENDISDEGANYLADMFKMNTKLIQLSVNQNQISDDGVKMLADVLKEGNTCLEYLNLSSNTNISDESIDILIEMIKHNLSLKTLDLRHCDFSRDGEAKLLDAAKSRKKVTVWLSKVM